MASKVIKLTEADLKLIVSNILKEQKEKIYTDYDGKYDYKVVNNKWMATKKGEAKWFSLNKYPKSIYKLNKKYPNATTTGNPDDSKSDNNQVKDSNNTNTPSFKNEEEGNSFRKYVNETFPKIAKKYSLDKTGKHDNSYIMKVAVVNVVMKKDLYSFKEGQTVQLFELWESFYDDSNSMSSKISKFSGGLYDSVVKGDYDTTIGHFLIPFVFPEYEPKIEKGGNSWFTPILKYVTGGSSDDTYGKLGHMGIATVEPNGQVSIFEFGRYSGADKGYGITKSKGLGKIAEINDGIVNNFKDICTKIKSNSQGEGPTQKMDCRLIPVTNVNDSISQATKVTTKKYEAFDGSTSDDDANCGTYTIEIAKAGGVPMGDFCFPNPTGVIKQFNKYSVDSVVV
jgi:hypothetical protein